MSLLKQINNGAEQFQHRPDGTFISQNMLQHYRSNNFNGDMRKRVYPVKQQDQWRAQYEGGR